MTLDLPIRYAARPGDVAATDLSVDGAFGSKSRSKVHLAHWPGNLTPKELRRDLSTEIAFAFTDLPTDEQQRITAGCTSLSLNHYDTDGLCALFALTRTDQAQASRQLLIEIAAAGDFFAVRSDRAFAIDVALRRYAEQRPKAPAGEDRRADRETLIAEALDLLGRLLVDAEHAPELWRDDLAALAQDRADLEAATFDDLIYMDLAIWTAAHDASSTRDGSSAPTVPAFDPGRHALLAGERADRVLVLGPGTGGTTARFIVGTWSFFDVVSKIPSKRPDLAALVARLNQREGSGPENAQAWRAQDIAGATPELWFGAPDLPLYEEHASAFLGRSVLEPELIKREVLDAVRDAWALPDDDDEADPDEDIFAV